MRAWRIKQVLEENASMIQRIEGILGVVRNAPKQDRVKGDLEDLARFKSEVEGFKKMLESLSPDTTEAARMTADTVLNTVSEKLKARKQSLDALEARRSYWSVRNSQPELFERRPSLGTGFATLDINGRRKYSSDPFDGNGQY
ncbi:MAG: hypothetical protein ABIP96_00840 [Patescibacteria group bacterium]